MSSTRRQDGRLPKVGDVYAIPVADGRFGACRGMALRREGRGSDEQLQFVAVTGYVGPAPPDIGHPDLRKTLVLTCDDWDEPYAAWVQDPAAGRLHACGGHQA